MKQLAKLTDDQDREHHSKPVKRDCADVVAENETISETWSAASIELAVVALIKVSMNSIEI